MFNNRSMGARCLFAYFTFLALTSYVSYATDPTQLQDFCVGLNDPNNELFVNGMFCKNPMAVKPEDFFAEGLDKPGDTNNRVRVTLISALQLAGLNTLGISIARIDFAPYGLNPLHTHPGATEILTVIKGTLYVGFVTSNQANGDNKLFAKVLKKGDVFVFPQGLIHFQFNVGKAPAFAIAALSSQNPGTVTIAQAVFGADPPISVDVLSKSFQLDDHVIGTLTESTSAAPHN